MKTAVILALTAVFAFAGITSFAETADCIVRAIDQSGDPVEGVTISFCTNDLCVPLTTDENGEAILSGDPEKYEVHILKLPEGCSVDETEQIYTITDGELLITVFRNDETNENDAAQ